MKIKNLLILIQLINCLIFCSSSNKIENLTDKVGAILDAFLEKFNNLESRFGEQVRDLEKRIESKFNKNFNELNTTLIKSLDEIKNGLEKRIEVIEDRFNFYSLETNISIDDLIEKDYKCVYNFTYSHSTNSEELNKIRSSCDYDSILCAGGGETNSNLLKLVSCGHCLKVLKETEINKPNLINGAYWYNTPSKSFGFSPPSSIKQGTCDVSSHSDSKRMCWHLTDNGGWRLGELINMNESKNYLKYIFIRF